MRYVYLLKQKVIYSFKKFEVFIHSFYFCLLGLFHKAISQSGVVSNPWAHTCSNKQHGFALAKAFGKECSTPTEAIECLRTIPPLDLVAMYENINKMVSLLFTILKLSANILLFFYF